MRKLTSILLLAAVALALPTTLMAKGPDKDGPDPPSKGDGPDKDPPDPKDPKDPPLRK